MKALVVLITVIENDVEYLIVTLASVLGVTRLLSSSDD